ncbi:MAG: cytochrome-c oxidase, cbb3-type subunit III [Oceanospirillaceae bacterium]|nr:cytochrome-c oxidase, cbb3-type subunit III [Oceanospirillaceae bacterium]
MSNLSPFWHFWVAAIVIGTMVACFVLLHLTRKGQVNNETTDQTTGHAYDGIEELDNPLPKWWYMMFAGTIVFGFIYIAIYGVGNWTGLSNWSSHGQWEKEVATFNEKTAPYYAEMNAKSVEELSKDPAALETGKRLFQSNCAVCHGSTAEGALGFPNLTDNDWLYGGAGDTIKTTILGGRNGAMPARGLMPTMTDAQVSDIVAFLMSKSERVAEAGDKANGEALFAQACSACHGADAKGNQMVGAPNLTDNIWLYGGSEAQITFTIKNGRSGVMPAWAERLGEDKVHVLAAYVYSLSQK